MAQRQEKKLPFTPDQLAAARQLLSRMSQAQLARAAGVSKQTIFMFEAGRTVPHQETLMRIKDAMEKRGIVFTNGDRPGVAIDLTKAMPPK